MYKEDNNPDNPKKNQIFRGKNITFSTQAEQGSQGTDGTDRGPDSPRPPSSPSADGDTGRTGPDQVAGIDFRYINIITQPEFVQLKENFKMPDLSTLKQINLNEEKAELEKMIRAGIVPSSQRMMEFVSACYVRNPDQADAFECLADYFKLEEGLGNETAQEMKIFLAVVESDKLAL
jgi:hypothetical protein